MEESAVGFSSTHMKMTVTINTQHGNVDIATDVISTFVGAQWRKQREASL